MKWNDILQAVTNCFVILTAIIALITLALNIAKELIGAKPAPFRRRLEYTNNFGDYLANYGKGIMTIVDIQLYYNHRKSYEPSLVDLIMSKLTFKGPLMWSTFLRNSELIGRAVPAQYELKLVGINPEKQKGYNPRKLLDELLAIRENIDIEITYKNAYGIKRKTKI